VEVEEVRTAGRLALVELVVVVRGQTTTRQALQAQLIRAVAVVVEVLGLRPVAQAALVAPVS